MSVFGPNQVEELIVGDAYAAETTSADFIASATDKEIKVLSSDGTNAATGVDFKFLQKTNGAPGKGLNFEFSDTIGADKVNKVIVKEFAAEVEKSVIVSGFTGNVLANHTYAVEVRVYNDGGTLSPENFAVVTGYYTTGANITGVTDLAVRNGVINSLKSNFVRRGDFEVIIAGIDNDSFSITGRAQLVVPGKIIGKQIEFDVTAKVFDDTAVLHDNLGLLDAATSIGNHPGTGTGKYAVNLEWFTKGYKYEVYRATGYPADFGERTPYYTDQTLSYNAIHIKYYSQRANPSVETQEKVLTILTERAAIGDNAVTNAVLADLRTILGSANVPADLAVA